jgi:hypothetical protein
MALVNKASDAHRRQEMPMNEKDWTDLPAGDTPLSLLSRIAFRIRRNGPLWLLRRLYGEIQAPLTGPGRLLNGLFRRMSQIGRTLGGQRPAVSTDTLLAFYDLLAEPSTFDAIWFMMVAERKRRELGLLKIHVVFVGAEPGGERVEPLQYSQIVSRSSIRDRIMNILVPLAWSTGSVSGVEVLHDRREAAARLASWTQENVFPKGYSVTFRRSWIQEWMRETMMRPGESDLDNVFCASEAALAYVDKWSMAQGQGKPIVSITVRHYKYNPARNSDLPAWHRVADYLVGRGYFPIFVPDTESLADGIPKEVAAFAHMGEAAWNLNLRLALYERAFLNLGINNGPSFLYLVASKAKGIMFKLITAGLPSNEAPYLAQQGFKIGGQIGFCTQFQKCVWEDDGFDVIKTEFEDMERRILESGASRAVNPA